MQLLTKLSMRENIEFEKLTGKNQHNQKHMVPTNKVSKFLTKKHFEGYKQIAASYKFD